MWLNWKRCSLGALVLAALSLFLFGCSDFGGSSQNQTATKTVAGVVSDPDTGLPMANATVTAYGVGSNGQVSTPLGAAVTSNSRGQYSLRIPTSYTGPVVLDAEVPGSLTSKLAKLLFRTAGQHFRSPVPQSVIGKATIPPIMISLATDTVYQYVQQNAAASGRFNSANIQTATLAMEVFFGPNFNLTPPPATASDTNTSRQQQDLIVSTRAFASLVNSNSNAIVNIVASVATTGLTSSDASKIKSAMTAATAALAVQGTLPPEFTPSSVISTAISNVTGAPFAVSAAALNDVTPPTAAAGLTATVKSAKRIDLAWTTAATDDVGVDGYAIYRADSTGMFVTIDVVPGDAMGYSDLRALPNTTYSYRVVAFDKARNLADASNTASASTPVATDTIQPDTVAGLVCKAFDYKQVNLQWLPSTKTNADGTVVPVAGYYVYRDSVLIGTAVGTNFPDKEVAPLTQYTYYVKAFDALGNISVASQPVTVFTLADPAATNAPAAPTGVQLDGAATYNSVALTWTASTTSGATYNVYRNGVLIATGLTGTKYSDGTVVPGTYTYAVRAALAGAESAAAALDVNPVTVNPNSSPADATVPTSPTNLVVAKTGSTSVSLLWTASIMPSGSSFVAGYIVLRGDALGRNFTPVGTSLQPGFVDGSVAPATSYTYEVIAISSAGVLSDPTIGSFVVTTPGAVNLNDVTPPSAPATLTATPTSVSVALAWTASTDNVAVGGYIVSRQGPTDAAPVQIADVATLNYTDTTVASATQYTYTVQAYDNAFNYSTATSATTTTLAALPGHSIFGKVTLNGIGVANVAIALEDASGAAITDGNGAPVTTTTDASGNYFFVGVADNTYTVAPIVTGYVLFSPTTQMVTIAGANAVGVNFATNIAGSINGGVTFPTGGVNGSGTYPTGVTVIGVSYANGSVGTVVTYSTGNVSGLVNYGGAISGRVTTVPGGSPAVGIANVTVNLATVTVYTNGNPPTVTPVTTVTTDANGNYSFPIAASAAGNYQVTVTPPGGPYTTASPSSGYTVLVTGGSAITGKNFTLQ